MTRFAMAAAALSLPLAWDALCALLQRIDGRGLRRSIWAALGAAALAWPIALVALTRSANAGTAEWARPLSPLSTLPGQLAEAARYLRDRAGPNDVVLLDGTWHYLDIVFAFEAGLPEQKLDRLHWPDFDARLKSAPPTLAVLLQDGDLAIHRDAQDAREGSPRFAFRSLQFCLERRFVYASIYRRCDQR